MSRLSHYPTVLPDQAETAISEAEITSVIGKLDKYEYLVQFMNLEAERLAGFLADTAKDEARSEEFVGAENAIRDITEVWDTAVVYAKTPDYEAFVDMAAKLIMQAESRSTHRGYGQVARARWASYLYEAERQMFVLVGACAWNDVK